jgi:restriction endonuclease S subunit
MKGQKDKNTTKQKERKYITIYEGGVHIGDERHLDSGGPTGKCWALRKCFIYITNEETKPD